ncbi:MAG: hypothetical protein HRU20_06600, partial [Pseudomonadales bacterium]|nr:hypothetical protein [Pseudomonadales bacterium]
MKIKVFMFAVLFMPSSLLWAQQKVATAMPDLTPVGMSSENIFKLFFMLFAVLALIVGVGYLL